MMFLQGLEQGNKLVRVDRLDISRAPRADDKEGEVLSIAATISGFAVGEPSSSPPTAAPRPAAVSPIASGGVR